MGRLEHSASGLLLLISLLLIPLFTSGCGGGTTTALADDNQGGNQPPPAYQPAEIFTNVPDIPWDDEGALHGVSETSDTEIVILGSEYLMKHNAEVVGTTLVMTGRPEDQEGDGPNVAYGLYRVSGLSGMHPLALVTECLPAHLGDHYFIGVADYTTGRWLEFGPISTPEYEIDLSGPDHRFISRLGNLYFVIVVPPGHAATHSQSTLFLAGGGEDPPLPGAPHELVATDGAFETHVVIEWNKGEGAAYYEVWRQPTNEFHGASAEPEWVRIGMPETNRFVDDDVEAGRIYRYKARSVNDAGYSAFSNIDTGYAGSAGGGEGDPPGKPIELWATDGEFENGVKVQWDGGEGAAWFRIARQDVEPESEWVVIGETEAKHYFDEDVVPGKVYRYKAQAVNEHGHSDWSNTDTGYAAGGTGGDPPGRPIELWATDGTIQGAVKVQWDGGEGAAWFRVARQDVEPETEWVVIGETESHMYLDEDVVAEQVYRYKAQAVNAHGHSDWSNTDTGYAAGAGGGPPDRPIELWASDGTYENGVKLEWGGGEGASWFIVQRTHGEGEWVTIGDPVERGFFDETAEPGVIYKYRVKAGNEHGESDWSNVDTGWRAGGGGPPGHPWELVASDGTYENAVKLEWGGGEGAAWFRIARQDVEPLSEWVVIGESEGHMYWDEDVIPGKHYRYKVQAVNAHGQSEWSNTDTGYAAEGGGDGYKIGGYVKKGEAGLSCAVTLLVVGDDEVTVETGENGHYLFDGLSAGMYIVYPHHPLHRFTPDYQVVHLTPEHPVAEVNFSAWEADDTHQAYGFVYSLISGEGGIQLVPLSGTNVVAWQEGTEFEVHVTTNEDGYFRIFDLPDGVVLFKPTKEGYVFVPTIHDATISGEGMPHALNFRGHLAP